VTWEEGTWAAWLYDLLQPQVQHRFLGIRSEMKAAFCGQLAQSPLTGLTLHTSTVLILRSELQNPFPICFLHFPTPENNSKQLGFDGGLMASSGCFFRRGHGIVSGLTTTLSCRSGCMVLPMYHWPSAEWAASSRFCCPYEKASVHFWLLTKNHFGSKFSARSL
jgi:hypothetical protein